MSIPCNRSFPAKLPCPTWNKISRLYSGRLATEILSFFLLCQNWGGVLHCEIHPEEGNQCLNWHDFSLLCVCANFEIQKAPGKGLNIHEYSRFIQFYFCFWCGLCLDPEKSWKDPWLKSYMMYINEPKFATHSFCSYDICWDVLNEPFWDHVDSRILMVQPGKDEDVR